MSSRRLPLLTALSLITVAALVRCLTVSASKEKPMWRSIGFSGAEALLPLGSGPTTHHAQSYMLIVRVDPDPVTRNRSLMIEWPFTRAVKE